MNQIKIGFSLPHMGSLATAENIAYAARFGDFMVIALIF